LIVDGRQPNYSLGASLTDLFKMMKAAGAYNAINMDGGGSTTLVYHDVGLNETLKILGSVPTVEVKVIGEGKEW
jgi:exopolysaccharide biosynthesis protein